MFDETLFGRLSLDAAAAVHKAIASKGRYRGYIARSAPPASSAAYAARQAILMRVNPYKVSIGGIMFLDAGQKKIYEEVASWIDFMPLREAIKLDKDRSELQGMGVW
jgi:hypothetical protein